MLGIQKISHLARHLGTTPDRLIEVAETAPSFCEELELIDPAKPEKKPRDVLDVRGDLRTLQTRLLRKLLRPSHQPSRWSHGGVVGRHIKSNVSAHISSTFAFPSDVANFYPSITNTRVFNLFLKDFCCHPEVARVCTKLCTYRYHLALGLITSPILADCIMMPIDRRLASMCEKQGLIYTRFVDDITFSGRFPIKTGSYPDLIVAVLASHGFTVNPRKHQEALEGLGRLADGTRITKLEIVRRRMRVRREFLDEVKNQLSDAARLATGKPPLGHYYTENQINGRIHFVSWINPGQAVPLRHRFRAVNWPRFKAMASERGYLKTGKILRKKGIPASTEDESRSLSDCLTMVRAPN
jgi:RNA-directed DNA polymerase